MSVFDGLFRLLQLEKPEPDYDSLDWRTFRLDESIWNERPRVSIEYVRSLQVVYELALQELGDSYLVNTEGLRERWNELFYENCDNVRDLEILRGENAALKIQLKAALEWQTQGGLKSQVFSENGVEEAPRKEVKTDSNNRFTAADGVPKMDKMKNVAAMKEYGITIKDIAAELHLSESTVKSYLSTIRGHYRVDSLIGKPIVVFEDGDRWDLDERFGDQWEDKETDATTAGSNEKGTIRKTLDIPINYRQVPIN